MDNKSIVWMTGLSGAGKTTLALGLKKQLDMAGRASYVLDGDLLRKGINGDLNFSRESRRENVRRIAHIAKLFSDAGIIPIIAAISPYKEDRDNARVILTGYRFMEVYIKCSLSECERRDPKGLYKKVKENAIANFTGISDIFEAPANADILIDTENSSYRFCLDRLYRSIDADDTGVIKEEINFSGGQVL
jgi:adenylyl-sulfate kinase